MLNLKEKGPFVCLWLFISTHTEEDMIAGWDKAENYAWDTYIKLPSKNATTRQDSNKDICLCFRCRVVEISLCYGLNYVPSKFICWNSNSQYLRCNLIGYRVLTEVIKLK